MEFSGEFTIGRKETTRFSRQVVMGKNQIVLFLSFAIGLLVGNYVLRIVMPAPPMMPQLLASLAGGAVVYGLVYGALRYGVMRTEMNAYTSGHRWSHPQTLQIGPAVIRCTTEEGVGEEGFDEVVVHETAEDFYFYTGREAAWILPKEQLKDPEGDAETVRKILRKMVTSDRLFLRREKK